MRGLRAILLPVFLLTTGQVHAAADIPVDRVVRAYDADTVTVQYQKDGKVIVESIRVRNIDAPEMGWRAKCAREAIIAELARDEARRFLASGKKVELVGVISRDRFKRLRARIEVDGKDLGQHLLSKKNPDLVRPWIEKGWNGTEKDWCAEEVSR